MITLVRLERLISQINHSSPMNKYQITKQKSKKYIDKDKYTSYEFNKIKERTLYSMEIKMKMQTFSCLNKSMINKSVNTIPSIYYEFRTNSLHSYNGIHNLRYCDNVYILSK